MKELSYIEIDATAGGRPSWLFIYSAVVDFFEGFSEGWKDADPSRRGGLDGWTLPNGESLPT
jgi:hypothetical protein